MDAGPELSVAATKTFVSSLTALLNFVANWANAPEMIAAIDRLPDRLSSAADLDWARAVSSTLGGKTLATLGRGPTFAIAQEAALKLKEVCNVHAEAFSGAEFQHGPIALVSSGYPIVIFMPTDVAAAHLSELAADLRGKGASVFITANDGEVGSQLPILSPDRVLDTEFLYSGNSARPAPRHRRRSAETFAEDHSHPMNEPKRHAIAAGNVFDGWTTHKNAAVVIEGSLIADVLLQAELPPGLEVREFSSGNLASPGFVDLQVNGGGDVLFNNSPTPDAILAIAVAHRKFGTTALLPTFITDTPEKMTAAFAAAQSLVGDEPSVLGIHLEGPFLSPERAGVHDANLIRQPGPDDLRMLCGPRKGTLVVTLAPERVPKGFVAQLAKSGIRVSLGHSMATYEETLAAMTAGLSGFTHLFNAMRPLASREPGPIAAALEVTEGLVRDDCRWIPCEPRDASPGTAGLRSALSCHRCDATGWRPPSKFDLYGSAIQVVGGRCAKPDGTLAGSALSMVAAVRNSVRELEVPLEMALRFASRNPAEFLGLGSVLGGLRPGYRADVGALNSDNFDVLGTWVAGKESGA